MQIFFPPSCGGCRMRGVWICESCAAEMAAPRISLCIFCGIAAATGGRICPSCAAHSGLEAIVWPWQYRHEKTRRIITEYKYKGLRGYAPYLALHLARCIEKDLPTGEWLIVPIPLHTRKEKERGYNQSLLVARELPYAMADGLLLRTKETLPQARSDSRNARLEAIRNAFAVRNADHIAGKSFLLVDDVATTGATLREAARTLKRAGAVRIAAAVLAHG